MEETARNRGVGGADGVGARRRSARAGVATDVEAQTAVVAEAEYESCCELEFDDPPMDDDAMSEDPFGHVAADLAAAPAATAVLQAGLTQPWRGEDEGRGLAIATRTEKPSTRKRKGAAGEERGEEQEGGSGPARRRQRASGSNPAGGAEEQPEGGWPRGEKRAAEPGQQVLGRKRACRTDAEGGEASLGGCQSEEGGQREEAQDVTAEGGSVPRGRVYGRRYTGIHADPVDAADSSGHALRITGPLIWCSRCGRYAMRRVRRSLREACAGEATGAYATRLARLWAGKHPLTDARLS